MGLEVLVPIVMGALLKVAGRVADGALGAVEEAGKDSAASILAKIKAWWSGDSSAAEDIAKFEAEPGIYQPVVEARMIQKLAADPQMQVELSQLAEKIAGPDVEVFQNIAAAHGVTGAKVEEMLAGRLHVDQRMEDAENVTGVEIKRMG